MFPRTQQAGESKLRCDVLSHGGERYSTPAAALPRWRRMALGCGLMAVMAFAAACTGDDNGTTGTGGAGGTGGTGGGGGGTGPYDANNMDGFVTCPQPGEPLDTYQANLVKPGSDGVLTFTLVESDNAPPSRGNNSWLLKITKKDQTPVTGEIRPKISMPHHTHPPSKAPDITYDTAKGLYTVTPVYLFMPGYWSAQFEAFEGSTDAGTPLDRGTFYFCVE